MSTNQVTKNVWNPDRKCSNWYSKSQKHRKLKIQSSKSQSFRYFQTLGVWYLGAHCIFSEWKFIVIAFISLFVCSNDNYVLLNDDLCDFLLNTLKFQKLYTLSERRVWWGRFNANDTFSSAHFLICKKQSLESGYTWFVFQSAKLSLSTQINNGQDKLFV